jgi:hypothetical protein
MLGKMLSQPPERLAADGWLASAKMDLGLERSLLAVLTNKLSHHSPTHGETRRQSLVAALFVLISGHDPLTQIHR